MGCISSVVLSYPSTTSRHGRNTKVQRSKNICSIRGKWAPGLYVREGLGVRPPPPEWPKENLTNYKAKWKVANYDTRHSEDTKWCITTPVLESILVLFSVNVACRSQITRCSSIYLKRPIVNLICTKYADYIFPTFKLHFIHGLHLIDYSIQIYYIDVRTVWRNTPQKWP